MANSNIEISFQNLVNVIKEKTYPAASGAVVEADIADIKIDITDLGISKIGISQIGMPGGVAPTSHTHTKSQITDFPESMPASDVHTWAKAANKPDYTPVEIGAIGISQVGMANGVASLGNDGKVPSGQLPAMTIPVTSVNNKTGDVELTPSDIGALGISQVGMAGGAASLDSNGKIPASQLPNTGSDAYRYNIVTKSTGGSDASITIKKYFNEELVSSTDYPYQTFDHTHVIIDSLFDMIYAEDGQAKYTMTLLENSTDHNAGYSKRWGYDEIVDFSETFVMSDEDISFIAPPFYANVSYAVGDKVTRNGSFYRCKTPHTGAWDIADFDKISVDELFDEVYDSLDDIQISIDQLGISKIGISQIGMANGVCPLDENGELDLEDVGVEEITQAEIETMWGLSPESSGNFFLKASTDQNVLEYEVEESGTYLVVAGYSHGGSASIAFTDADIISEKNKIIEVSGENRGFITKIATVDEGETITINLSWTSWDGRLAAIIKLENIEIDPNDDISPVGMEDGQITYSLPNDDNYYLVFGSAIGNSSSSNHIDNTEYFNMNATEGYRSPLVVMGGTWSYGNTSSLTLCKGSESPEFDFYGYDGGIAAVFAWKLA